MTFLSLWNWLKPQQRHSAVCRRRHRRHERTLRARAVLRLEVLEDRMVPSQNGYIQTNLVSDISGLAQITDPNLKNPWGISESASGPFSISDQAANVSTQYAVTAAGVCQVPGTIAFAPTAGPHGPTGQVFNDTSSFLVNGAPATTIFANLNGTISAWNTGTGTTAQVVVNTNGAAVYTGLDMGSNDSGDFLFAANPKKGRIDVYNDSFVFQNLGPNAFVDPSLQAGLVPFNVDNINGVLYVTYAAAGPPVARNSAPEGVGAVSMFDTSGNFIKQVTAGGKLASPWGITLAPSSFGEFGGDLLVGNFSYNAGEINAYDPVSGAYQGTLADENGNTLLAGSQGLWYLTFGNGGNGGLADTLYFTAGLNAETDGLFGAIIPTPENGNSQGSNGQWDGLRASLTNGGLSNSVFVGNQATGGLMSGNSGAGQEGGLSNVNGLIGALSLSTVARNMVLGGAGGLGGNSGNGLGGASYEDAGPMPTTASLSLMGATADNNHAIGGAAVSDSSAGKGVDGGHHHTPGSGACADALTESFANHTTTSDDDVFRVLS
jgi:uncharacterized protein (TIGR03118 family)